MYYRGYQKLLHVLLCEDDQGTNDGQGKPVKRVRYDDCEFLESSNFFDKKRHEVFEADIVKVCHEGKMFVDVVDAIPDMFGSKKIHPLRSVLVRHGIQGNPEYLDVEVLGNRYETPEFLPKR